MGRSENRKNIYLLIILLMIIVGLSVKRLSSLFYNTADELKETNPGSEVISLNSTSQQVYTNTKYGFGFTVPQGWHLGDENLELGTLQLFNYDEQDPIYAKGGFKRFPSINKIETSIRDDYNYAPSEEYPSQLKSSEKIEISGSEVLKQLVEFADGTLLLTYVITLPNMKDKYFILNIYGNPDNFYVLDDLVKSIAWTNKP